MRSLRGIAAYVLASASVGGLISDGAGRPRFVIGGSSRSERVASTEDRRRRNLAAGGRDKRIKRSKTPRSYRRRPAANGSPGFGRLFKSDKREAAFGAALADGKSRNEAAKIARRVTA